MFLDNVLLNIKGYFQLLETTEEVENSGELASKPILIKIQKIEESLIALEGDKIGLLLEIDREVRILDECYKYPISSFAVQAKKAFLQFKKMIQSINEALFESFLKLDSSDQEDRLGDYEFLKRVENCVCHANQGKIRNIKFGDVLFHQLLRCKSERVRQLALFCLDAGAEINCKNKEGLTGLHLVAQIGDESLVKEFIKKGADQSIKTFSRLLTPLDIAINSYHYSCGLALALEDPLKKIDEQSAPEYFIRQMQHSERGIKAESLVHLLEEFSRKEDINSFANGIWEACGDVANDLEEQESNDLEEVVDWLLSHDVCSESIFCGQLFVISWLVERMLERKLTGHNDEALLEIMIERKVLSIAISDSHRSMPLEIHQQISNGQLTISSKLKDKITELTEKMPLDIYEDFNRLVERLGCEIDVSVLSEIYQKIEERIAELIKQNFPNIKTIKSNLKKSIVWQINTIKEYRRDTLKLLLESKDFERIESLEYKSWLDLFVENDSQYLRGKFVENNRWDLISELMIVEKKYSENFLANKLIYHLMMDKLLFKEAVEYKSCKTSITAYAFIRALDRMSEMSSQKVKIKRLEEIISTIHDYLTPLLKEIILQEALYWSSEKLALRVVEKLQVLEEGACLLVKTGCWGHSTCLLIEKRDTEHFRMTHYNTGNGVQKWHYRGKQTNKCQTFDIIDNIPSESILDQQGWELLFDYRLESSNMDSIYATLRNILGKGGKRLPRSIHDEDYEAKQSSGTCSMQVLMAVLRHQIMELTEGTPSERKALYKLFKVQMLTQFYHDHLEQIDETINSNLSTVLNKLSAQWTLVKLSENVDEFDEALIVMINILDRLEEGKVVKTLLSQDKTTNLSRYATLRNASNLLCSAWLNHPEAISSIELEQQRVLQFALAKFKHQLAIIRNINSRLQKCSEEGDIKGLTTELYRTILATSFTEMGIQEAVNRLGKEEPTYKGTKKLLKNLNNYREQSEPLVREFQLRLLKDSPEQGMYVENYWQELS